MLIFLRLVASVNKNINRRPYLYLAAYISKPGRTERLSFSSQCKPLLVKLPCTALAVPPHLAGPHEEHFRISLNLCPDPGFVDFRWWTVVVPRIMPYGARLAWAWHQRFPASQRNCCSVSSFLPVGYDLRVLCADHAGAAAPITYRPLLTTNT